MSTSYMDKLVLYYAGSIFDHGKPVIIMINTLEIFVIHIGISEKDDVAELFILYLLDV